MSEDGKREAYEAPAVVRVHFAPGEVAAANCKRPPASPVPPGAGAKCNRGGGVTVAVRLGS